MMHAREFNKVPPIERNHWINYQIQKKQAADRKQHFIESCQDSIRCFNVLLV